eukprot:TRINITY_DN4747_c0_g2_i1.p1 TRINITY_DN4747_c0_g2~~TRINITY_DN4747_c0_g2_i1.p1  ORF type:complete len:278 (-),score=86.50 TRINITY_DN4747_c0_g2_i1:44-877(-)
MSSSSLSIMHDWASTVCIPLRRYQVRMCEAACGHNAVIVLPTGSGKTMIAAALTSWHHHHHHRHHHDGTRIITSSITNKTLFLVPTQMLVAQQANALETYCSPPLRVCRYHGELRWPHESEYDALVSTPEALRLKMAETGFSLSAFSFVVFDEVHHVMKKHPYAKVARLLQVTSPSPSVLGLTATCTYAVGEAKIEAEMKMLCASLNISVLLSAPTDELVRDGYHGATPALHLLVPTTSSSASSSSSSLSSSSSSSSSSSTSSLSSSSSSSHHHDSA